jgi:hypothetical protein
MNEQYLISHHICDLNEKIAIKVVFLQIAVSIHSILIKKFEHFFFENNRERVTH